jgi:hypothetical protein
VEKQVLGPSAAAELQQLLIDTGSLTDVLAEVSRYAAATIGSGLSCGITLSRDGRPCSMRTGQVVTINDLAAEDRWGN